MGSRLPGLWRRRPGSRRAGTQRGEIVRSEAYTACPGSEATRPFRRWALLSPGAGPAPLLQAAWAAEDAGLEAEATALRREAAALWPDTPGQALARVDVLRRAGLFEVAEDAAVRVAAGTPDEVTAAILSFQRARIAARDTGRYLMSAAVRPPAHAPHVFHGKSNRAKGGLWARLLGRRF